VLYCTNRCGGTVNPLENLPGYGSGHSRRDAVDSYAIGYLIGFQLVRKFKSRSGACWKSRYKVVVVQCDDRERNETDEK